MKFLGIAVLILIIGVCVIINITNFEKKLDIIMERQETMINVQQDMLDMLGDEPEYKCECQCNK